MKKTIIVFILTTLLSCKSSYTKIGDKDANYIPYYLKVYEADSLYLTENYTRSYEILDSLFKKFEPKNQNRNTLYLCEFEKYIKLKYKLNKPINKQDFEKLITEFGYLPSTIKNDNKLTEIKEKLKINNEEIEHLFKNYLSTIDYALRSELKEIEKVDQECRRNLRKNKDTLILPLLFKKITETDSINNIKIKEIFKKYKGYPYPKYSGNSMISENKYDTFVYMNTSILHQCSIGKPYERDFYLNFLYEELKKGKYDPVEYAICYDRIHLKKESETFLFSDSKNIEKLSNKEKKKINIERKKHGIFSLEYQMMKNSNQ